MMKTKQHSIDFLFILLVLGFFTFASLSVINIGAHIYQNITTSMETNFQTKTPSQYIIEKIHRDYFQGNSHIVEIEGKSAIAIENQNHYVTYLYQDDGKLKELLIADNRNPTLNLGEAIMDLNQLDIELVNEHLLKLTFYYTNSNEETYISIL